MEDEGRNYKLRLGLPEITQPYLGNWLGPGDGSLSLTNLADSNHTFDQPTYGAWLSVDDNLTNSSRSLDAEALHKSFPTNLTRPPSQESNFSAISVANDVKSNASTAKFSASGWGLAVTGSGTSSAGSLTHRSIEIPAKGENGEEGLDQKDAGHEVNERLWESKRSDLWMHAGKVAKAEPKLLQWEVSHLLDGMLPRMSFFKFLDKIALGGGVSDSIHTGRKRISPPQDLFDLIQETDLVRAALCALQGIPTAVCWLEHLAATFSSTAADRSSDKLQTLWLRSSSTLSLSKVLAEFAKTGRVVYQLDCFTSFFLDKRNDIDRTSVSQKAGGEALNRKKRKRKDYSPESAREAVCDALPENWDDLEASEISPHCLINQAYAAAVRTLMQGNLAALNTVGASATYRRANGIAGQPLHMAKPKVEDTGSIINFGCGDITLLELFLHSRRQREQLQALAAICRIDQGAGLKGLSPESLEQALPSGDLDKDITNENSGALPSELESFGINVSTRALEGFPRGAELLTYLYVKLSESDTLHLELLRFLFERACQPYTEFIYSWLYHASVEDPYNEFIVKPTSLRNSSLITNEQAALPSFQVRKGVSVPCFLEDVCTPLLRAGQQLQVLSKLLDTRQLAPLIMNHPLGASGGPEDLPMGSSLLAHFIHSECYPSGLVLHFSKKRLQGDMQRRDRQSQLMKERHNCLFAKLANAHLTQDKVVELEVVQDTVPTSRCIQKETVKADVHKNMTLEKFSKLTLNSNRGSMALAALRMEGTDDLSVASERKLNRITTQLQSATSLAPEMKEPCSRWLSKSIYEDNVFHVPDSGRKMSYLSVFHRGTMWPLLGLPKNPFLCYDDEAESPFRYTHTSFPVNNLGWDVAVHWGDSISLSNPGSRHLQDPDGRPILHHKLGLEKQRCETDERDWFTKLEEKFKQQITCGLDEQILQANYENLGFDFERENGHWSPYSLDRQPWGYNTCLRSSTSEQYAGRCLQTNPEKEVVDSSTVSAFKGQYSFEEYKQPNKVGGISVKTKRRDTEVSSQGSIDTLTDKSLPVRADILKVEQFTETALAQNVHAEDNAAGVSPLGTAYEVCEESDRTEGTDMECLHNDEEAASDACEMGRGANWETYLSFQHDRVVDKEPQQSTLHCEDSEDSDEEIPLVVAVNQCIVQEILHQYNCASILTVRLLQESLHLQDHCTALRRYYFMETGDWAEYFLTSLCKHEWNRVGGQPRSLEVQSMLGTALQNSSCEGDAYAERLYIVQSTLDSHSSFLLNPLTGLVQQARFLGNLVNCNHVDAFDFIKMGYKVDWPLSLILTPSSIRMYSSIFTFLMRMKLTMYSLADIWRHLQLIGHSLDKGRKQSDYQEQNRKFRKLQLFRQQVGHVVTTIQRYTESQLLHVIWSRFLNSVENEVKDIHALEKVHVVYLEDARHQCFLSADMGDVKSCIDTIMQCTLDFRAKLLAASLDNNGIRISISDELYSKVLEVKDIFEAHLYELYSLHQRPEQQYSILLTDFWMCLDFNGFLGRSLQRKKCQI